MLNTKRQFKRIPCVTSYDNTMKVLLIPLLLLSLVLVYVWISACDTVLQHSQEPQRAGIFTVKNVTRKQNFEKGSKLRLDVEKAVKHVNPHNYDYIISEEDKCKDTDVYLLIAVLVTNDKFATRQAIRNSWGSVMSQQEQQVRFLFFVGKSISTTVNDKILNESTEFRDIVQEDFIDSYYNLTLKSVAILRWASLFCRQAAFVLKVDDDVFLNVKPLLKELRYRRYKGSIVGRRISNPKPTRDKQSKHYISTEEYNKTTYPEYTMGGAYIITGDIVEEMFTASLDIPYLKSEDVFIGGMCRLKINATLMHTETIECRTPRLRACLYNTFICGTVSHYRDMTKIWQGIQKNTTACS